MGRIFLSHSSADKEFVEPIADLLGKTKCVYDKYTFEIGMKTFDEIFQNIEASDIFVYFISQTSLNSDWVKEELNRAEELLGAPNKIKQIFPLIIDSSVDYSDTRIADFLKKSYNLQRVDSYVLAYRKILAQCSRIEFEKNLDNSSPQIDFFYGRDAQIANFKKRIDSVEPIKTAIISGIPGIGKKSFIKNALVNCKLIKPYYTPYILPFPHNGNIEDLILGLSNAGFGSYTLSELMALTSIDEKIDILVEQINAIQKYNELVIIEDNESIITLNGELKYWFYNAIKKSQNGLALIVSSNIGISNTNMRKYPDAHFENLVELDATESLGLLRTYSDFSGLDLSHTDRLYFKDCISGYPPQIIFCVDLIKEKGLDYAKRHTYDIASMPEQISSLMLEKCYNDCDEKYINGFLSLVSRIEIAPVKLINKICSLNENYKKAIISLKKYLLCYAVGSNGEYYKTNAFIADYISRNRFPLPDEIQKVLNDELENFNSCLETDNELQDWDINELRYYIKENIKNGIGDWSSFLYSTILLQTISELYHMQKYKKIIELVAELKSNPRYQYYDDTVITNIERYLCQSLVKSHNTSFESEVEYFRDNKLFVDYHYLKGLWSRCTGHYDRAIDNYKKVLDISSNHFATKRELVIVYLSLQDYDSGLTLAKSNYNRNKDNPYIIQAYFECLLEKRDITETQENDIQTMLSTINRINRLSPTPIYFQLHGKYEAYHERNLELGIKYIEDGLKIYQDNMYLLRDLFDIYRRYKNIIGMQTSLERLRNAVKDYAFKGVVDTRQAVLDLHNGQSVNAVEMRLRESGFSKQTIDNIINRFKPTS